MTSTHDNKQWATEMIRVGLQPVSIDNPGKMTGQKVTHDIVTGGPFDLAQAEFLLLGHTLTWKSHPEATATETTPSRNKIKYTCLICAINVWGKPDLNIVCGDCDEKLEADEDEN